jgi:hypothetical protein
VANLLEELIAAEAFLLETTAEHTVDGVLKAFQNSWDTGHRDLCFGFENINAKKLCIILRNFTASLLSSDSSWTDG